MAKEDNNSSSGTQTSSSSGADQGTKPTKMSQIVFDLAPKTRSASSIANRKVKPVDGTSWKPRQPPTPSGEKKK